MSDSPLGNGQHELFQKVAEKISAPRLKIPAAYKIKLYRIEGVEGLFMQTNEAGTKFKGYAASELNLPDDNPVMLVKHGQSNFYSYVRRFI